MKVTNPGGFESILTSHIDLDIYSHKDARDVRKYRLLVTMSFNIYWRYAFKFDLYSIL